MNTLSNRAALSALLAGAASSCLCTNAAAQATDSPITPNFITIDQIRGGDYVRSPYSSRAESIVYSTGIPAVTGGDFRSSGVNTYDDVTFAGPGASGPIEINGLAFGIIVPTSVSPGEHLYMRVSFYPNHDNTVPLTSRPYSGTPVVWNLDLGEFGGGCDPFCNPALGEPVIFDHSVVLDSTNVFTDPTDRTCGVYQELFLDPDMTIYADNWEIVRRGGMDHWEIGASDDFSWFDELAGVGPLDILNSDRSGSPTSRRATFLALAATYHTCDADFNGDGDSGTDQDIEAFFACLAGDCCNTCDSADFNGDGDSGTDADIESFFRVLAGGPC